MAAEIIQVNIRRNRDGWFVATSDDLPRLFIVDPDIAEVMVDVPVTIKALYKAQYDQDVQVLEDVYPSSREAAPAAFPWVTIPSHLVAKETASGSVPSDDSLGVPRTSLLTH